jgi:hypothetical protein
LACPNVSAKSVVLQLNIQERILIIARQIEAAQQVRVQHNLGANYLSKM